MSRTKSSLHPQQLAFAALVSGAYASAAVALLFLGIDAFRGALHFTPSLLGSVLLLGAEASPTLPVRLDMVAVYSLIHFLAFAGLGTVATFLYVAEPLFQRQPLLLGGAIVVTLMVGAGAVDLLIAPGLVSSIGPVGLMIGNIAAAGVMTAFIHNALSASLAQAAALAPVSSDGRGL